MSDTDKQQFHVTRLYHPSHHVIDLREAEAWFERVFGRQSRSIAEMTRNAPRERGVSNGLLDFYPDQ